MKILITGGKGMLGRTLAKEFSDHEIIVADLPDWDITDDDAIVEKICNASPDVVIHCAAMTKVDDCESNKDAAFKINEDGSRNVALACKICGARSPPGTTSRRAFQGTCIALTVISSTVTLQNLHSDAYHRVCPPDKP
jgi:nucleoside-diphosphate-sugar epimerase